MPRTENTNGALYAHNDLIVYEKVDREDNIYYPEDEITFTIVCLNDKNVKLENVLIQDILPYEVIPVDGDKFQVMTNSGTITQHNNIISVAIKSIEPKETVIIKIVGKVSE